MGRELRRVPVGWEHPKDWLGNEKPLFDRDYEVEAAEWHEGYMRWERGEDPAQLDSDTTTPRYYWEWHGVPPEQDRFRPSWPEAERTHYQVYENTTEGTPLSPVLHSPEAVVDWLVSEGYTRSAATAFVEHGYAPSFVMSFPAGGGNPAIADGIAAWDIMKASDTTS